MASCSISGTVKSEVSSLSLNPARKSLIISFPQGCDRNAQAGQVRTRTACAPSGRARAANRRTAGTAAPERRVAATTPARGWSGSDRAGRAKHARATADAGEARHAADQADCIPVAAVRATPFASSPGYVRQTAVRPAPPARDAERR
jgi:hypothetical protein